MLTHRIKKPSHDITKSFQEFRQLQ
ncbi:unnamed protein product, partial [Allacma fusca]